MVNNGNERNSDSIAFRIVEKIGVISTNQSGWLKELNLVSWNGGQAKFDIREWNPEHDRMTRGITLYESEAKKLAELMLDRFTSATENGGFVQGATA